MADQLDAYLARLARELPLPDSERAEAIEEVAAHIQAATADLEARGVPVDTAVARVISRFGHPERLADDLAAARRGPRQLATAAGTAIRVTLRTGFWTLTVTWIAIIIAALAISVLWTFAASVLDLDSRGTYGPQVAVLLSALATGLTAFAIGRALPPAVAEAARRRLQTVRPWILAIGVLACAGIGLFAIRAEFELIGAVVMGLLPAWFALGVLRPGLLPGWLPPANVKAVGLGLLLVVAALVPLGMLVNATGAVTTEPVLPPAYDNLERIAPYEDANDTLFASTGMWSAGVWRDLTWELSDPSAIQGWRDIHVEVWLGLGDDNVSGIGVLDPSVSAPVLTVPVMTEDGILQARLILPVVPERDHYLVALVGTNPDGDRRQLTQPQDELARWSGSVWEYLTVERPW